MPDGYRFTRFFLLRKRSSRELVLFSLCVYLVRLLCAILIPPQTAMDMRSSQDTLIDIFERMEAFFHRLEIYTTVPPPPQMMDIIVKVMVEVLSILGIATKEIKQNRMSK
jgi:hypothetical protein